MVWRDQNTVKIRFSAHDGVQVVKLVEGVLMVGVKVLVDGILDVVEWMSGLAVQIDANLIEYVFRDVVGWIIGCLLYTSPSPRDRTRSRMPSSA